MEGKPVSASKVSFIHQVMPGEANEPGQMHGGQLLKLLDSAAAICAFRHARGQLVTAAIEHMEFIAPAKPGDILTFHCSVNYVGRTSMEVGVRIEAEEYLSGKVVHISTCYLTFVGIDENGKPRPLPPLIAETDEEERRMSDAARRMALSRMGTRKTDSFLQRFTLIQLPERYAICRFDADADLSAVPLSVFLSLSYSEGEICAVVAHEHAQLLEDLGGEVARDFYCLQIGDSKAYKQVGIMASVSAILAFASIPIFTVCTTTTIFILFPVEMTSSMCSVLRSVGHVVEQPDPLP